MSHELEGLTAIVTGGGSGIGAMVARRIVAGGGRVGVFDLNPDTAPEGTTGFEVNVADDESVRAGVRAVADLFGSIDIVVNCAAISTVGTIESDSDEEWMRAFDVNVLGVVRVSRAALPWLRASPASSIVNIGSIAATIGFPDRAVYGTTKGAVYSLTLQMAADHLREGIRVNMVSPGTTDTPWVGRLLAKSDDPVAERRALEARQPHGRLVAPEEVAEAVAYLVNPLAGSTTGTALMVDGGLRGLRLRNP